MLQKGASCTSLLVESGSLPAAVTAPERSSLANQGPAATTHTSLDKWPTATLATTDFSAMAWRISVRAMAWRTSASALQSQPASILHQLTTRQPIYVELGTSVSSVDPANAFSSCLYHSYAEELPTFQQSFEDMGHLG